MTENWIYGCCGFKEDVSDSHWDTRETGIKNSSQNPFCEPYKNIIGMSSNNVKIDYRHCGVECIGIVV